MSRVLTIRICATATAADTAKANRATIACDFIVCSPARFSAAGFYSTPGAAQHGRAGYGRGRLVPHGAGAALVGRRFGPQAAGTGSFHSSTSPDQVLGFAFPRRRRAAPLQETSDSP